MATSMSSEFSDDSFGIKKFNSNPNSKIMGVVSSNPGMILGSYDTNNAIGRQAPVALAGRVPVKVTNENGAILPGDFLTASITRPWICNESN